jgi:tetratricopeptide (TPR) repeat protein
MPASAVWRSRPVFITSTFRDMHAERDWLRVHVFPVLEERLRERFHHLETIDLRWGVESASAEQETDRERLVLTVCLREIERSRPFLIGLLGDRYGWRPPADRLREAAGEAGLDADLDGRSVTELEILYGVLRNTDQARRTWFYFRERLPYDEMPREDAARYSDAFSPEPDAADRAARLAALKTRVIDALPGRVRTYAAAWDAETQSVSGLAAWGAQVLEDLWSDLEAETTEFLRQAPQTWQEQDRWALDEFIEGRARGFVGRTAITSQLMTLATSPAAEGTAWGACLTAEAGAGKSSLFGHLQQLLKERDVLVLAHAAGISVRSTQVDWMLRRWVGELAAALGEADPLDDTAPPDDIDQAFARLLGRVARERRVVVLIDALNQFEPTPRATHLTWGPRLWPPNARLIATAIPGTASSALLQRPGVFEVRLDPIDRDEALDIVRGICARYHRTLNRTVEARLLDKRRDDGTPAYGNPLWLELAAEALNLLGGDVFDRVDAAAGAEGVVQLLEQEVQRMPPDIAGLYRWMLDSAERNFGEAWTRAFVDAIAVSRSGWRESDLEALMPVLSGEAWDPLRFATLRRGLRAHVVQRGPHAQWDFAHAQMREAVESRADLHRRDLSVVHGAVADHLLQLRRDDPLHESETILHLVRGADPGQAARYYGGELTAGEEAGATSALASMVVARQVDKVAALLEHDVDPAERGRIGRRFLFDLMDAVEHTAALDVRAYLAIVAGTALDNLAAADPGNAEWQRDLAVSHETVGGLLRKQGDLPGALSAFKASLDIRERLQAADPHNAWQPRDLSGTYHLVADTLAALGDLSGALEGYRLSLAFAEQLAAADPGNAIWQRDLAVNRTRIGHVARAQGRLPDALAAYQESLSIVERLAAAHPRHAKHQGDLSGRYLDVGDVLQAQGELSGALAAYQASLDILERLAAADPQHTGWQTSLAANHERLGDVVLARGNLAGALEAYQKSHAIAERLAAADPGHTEWQRDLAVGHSKIGDVLQDLGNLPGALTACQASLAICDRLAAADPRNAEWQRDLAVSHSKVGDVLRAQGNLPGALTAYETSRAIHERLAAADRSNAIWQRDLAVSYARLGGVLQAQGNLLGALEAYQKNLAMAERLAATDPSNTEWQYGLGASHDRLGDVLRARGDLPGALEAYQRSLAIAEPLAAESGHAGSQRGLFVTQLKVGDVLEALGNLPDALAAYQTSLATAEGLAAADPGHAVWQHDLSVSHERIGDVLRAQGNLEGALTAYETSRAIRERLAEADRDNAEWQRDLALSFHKLATSYVQTNEGRAEENWWRCYEVLARMRAEGMHLEPQDLRLLAVLEDAIKNE